VRLVKVDTKEYATVGVRGGLSVPHLWIPSGNGASPAKPGPLDHLELYELIHYKQKLAHARDYSPIIAELRQTDQPEAKLILQELLRQAQKLADSAKNSERALDAIADYRRLATRFSELPIGQLAANMLAAEDFRLEYEAAQKLHILRSRMYRLQPVDGAKPVFTDKKYFERNKGTLKYLVELLGLMRPRYQGTVAMRQAEAIARAYKLPAWMPDAEPDKISIVGRLTEISHIPTYQQIAPYDTALCYAKSRIQYKVSGNYDAADVLVAFFVIKDKETTKAAKLKKGQKQFLELERLDAHPELQDVFVSNDTTDFDLVPYLAVTVINW
jgi:hypothetical protein